MNDTEVKTENKPADTEVKPAEGTQPQGDAGQRRGKFRGPRRGGGKKFERARVKPEFDSKMLTIRRVARVVSGGRRFSFSVALVAGNRKGMVGVGLAKAGDTTLAIEKAFKVARKNLVKVNMNEHKAIPHEVSAKYSSARVVIIPVKDRGLVAGSAMRTVLELAGVKNVVAKIVSPSKNKLNIARATVKALGSLNLEKPISLVK